MINLLSVLAETLIKWQPILFSSCKVGSEEKVNDKLKAFYVIIWQHVDVGLYFNMLPFYSVLKLINFRITKFSLNWNLRSCIWNAHTSIFFLIFWSVKQEYMCIVKKNTKCKYWAVNMFDLSDTAASYAINLSFICRTFIRLLLMSFWVK